MQTKRLPINKVELNTGQIEGLPSNPRQWTREDIDRIAKSLKETPELFEMRPCIVAENAGKYILLAGNLRFCGARQNGDSDVPCIVVPKDMSVDKMKEIVLKDNGSFGAWDFDSLANEWGDLPLTEWGVPAWDAEEEGVDVGSFEDDNYSRKIEIPTYEPTGEDVPITSCYDTEKYDKLVAEIKEARIPKDIKDFLLISATRHIVFTYDRIADFYANAPKEVQELMEKSALVFIDYDKAIENGFVEMSSLIRAQYGIDNPNGENYEED